MAQARLVEGPESGKLNLKDVIKLPVHGSAGVAELVDQYVKGKGRMKTSQYQAAPKNGLKLS